MKNRILLFPISVFMLTLQSEIKTSHLKENIFLKFLRIEAFKQEILKYKTI